MDDNVFRKTQQQGSNLFAFRRLKWGRPPERFRVEKVVRTATAARLLTTPATADEPEVADLAKKRRGERILDALAAMAAVVGILAALTAAFI